jgi:hypothetical protein
MSQHNGLDHHADLSFSDPDLLGQTDGASSFVPPGAFLWPSGGSALSLHMSELSPGVTASVSTPGSGLVFDNTYLSGCTAAFETCIVAAEKQLESLFSNSDTIVVSFNESSFGAGNPDAMNNSSSGYDYSYATLRAALMNAAPGDVLPSNDPSGGGNWFVPLAYARMLGLTTTTGSPDLSVSLNTDDTWSFGQDVINGVTHELSEGGMGRIGALGPKGAGATSDNTWGTMDLFRYDSAGQPDYNNGRDGATTYFSPDGGVTLSDQNEPNWGDPTLSYNNQYDSTGAKVNGGDTADWTQQNVFGATGGGETLALTQTELEVLQALGWHLTLTQDVLSGGGNWETPTGWSTGSMPIEAQDVYISGGSVTLDSDVLVNSISNDGILSIGDTAPTTLIAVDGTGLNPEDVSAVASGNFGTIAVYINSTLQIGSTNEQFYNPGSVVLGKGAGGFGSADLDIAGQVSLTGGGQIDMGGAGIEALILDAPGTSSDSLVNVNNTISGGGLILIDNFQNEAGGSVVATSQEYLQIIVGSFINQGTILAESNGTIDFGEDGATQSLSNDGSVVAEAGSTLEISGNYFVSGSGVIEFTGAGARIVSDGASASFTNASYIDAYASGEIGDADLTFDNAGTTAVLQAGAVLTINTGANIVTNNGTLAAENGGTLAIASSLINNGILEAGASSSNPNGTLDLGTDGSTASADDSGSIEVWGGGDLAISGNYTVFGGGQTELKGAGAEITSDGNAAATFTNAGDIETFGSGQIGDVGIKAANDLTFSNTGTVLTTEGGTLTINTGAHAVNDSGLLQADGGTTIVIDSNITTGSSGIIDADPGTVLINGAVSGSGTLSCGIVDAGVLDLAGGGSFGGVISGNGTVIIGGALTLHAGASLSAADVIETAGLTLASVSVTNATDDNFTMTAASGVMITLGSTGTGSFTNDGTMLVNGAGTARITAPLIDAGTIAVTGGMLEVTGKLSGSGSLSVASGATAYLTAGGALTETISGAGVLELGGAYSLAGDVAAGTVLVNAAHSLSGSGTLAGAVINRGSVASSGGWLTIDGPVSGTGTFAAGAGTLLDLAGGGSFAGVLASTGTGEVFLAGATTLTPGAKLAGHVVDSANLKLAGVAVTNAAGNIFSLQGAETLSSSGAGAFINDGEFVHSFGQTATVSAPFTNSGIVSAQSGTLSFLGSIAGTGTMDLGIAGTIALGLGAANQLVDFEGLGSGLELAHPLDFAGSITGFASHDSIFLENTSFTGFSFNNDLLTVKHGSTTVASLNIIETSNQFTLTTENHGVLITFG